jgi:hypothetical protein
MKGIIKEMIQTINMIVITVRFLGSYIMQYWQLTEKVAREIWRGGSWRKTARFFGSYIMQYSQLAENVARQELKKKVARQELNHFTAWRAALNSRGTQRTRRKKSGVRQELKKKWRARTWIISPLSTRNGPMTLIACMMQRE